MSGVLGGSSAVLPLDVGQTTRATLSFLRRNLAVAVPLGILLGVVPALISGQLPAWPNLMPAVLEVLPNWSALMQIIGIEFASATSAIRLADLVASIAAQGLLTACLAHAALSDADELPPSFARSLGAGLRRILPVLGLTLVINLGIVLGLLLLIVPGVILSAKWLVAVPVRVAEGPGAGRSLDRSARLVEGNKWRCLALILLFIVLPMIAVGGAESMMELLEYPETTLLGSIVTACAMGIYSTLNCALPGVLYVQLRRLKDGAGPQQTASVFG